jgi:hypothetical protein
MADPDPRLRASMGQGLLEEVWASSLIENALSLAQNSHLVKTGSLPMSLTPIIYIFLNFVPLFCLFLRGRFVAKVRSEDVVQEIGTAHLLHNTPRQYPGGSSVLCHCAVAGSLGQFLKAPGVATG